MKRPTLALALIAKNEAENLPRLFASIEGCFDEIHLTDTGSTDNTVEVAKKLGAIVHHFPWVDDFSAARNASFEPIKTDYIAWLDCDDVLENREGFLNFRDTAMSLADYWLANYHYSSDAAGNAVCTFVRERVFKNHIGFKWKYFVHEGVIPQSASVPVRVNFTPAWVVRHKRTDADLQKDRSRNLRLFSGKTDLDARLQYYYGKELFEAERPADAIPVLMKAASLPELELHDRIICIQYAGWAYARCNQFEQAVQIAYQGLQLAPHRAELWTLIGDCYLKQGKITDAIPAFSAAKACNPIPNGAPSPLFQMMDLYTHYPLNQLARVYANVGDFDQAEKLAAEAHEKYLHPESQAILAEIHKVQSLNQGYKNAAFCEDIVITCPGQAPYLWDADIAKNRSMGGSETAAIEMAYWLKRLSGRRVIVFNERPTPGIFDGVEYLPLTELQPYFAKHKPFLHVSWRHNLKLTDAPTFVWAHDLQTPGVENHAQYERMLCLTPFHKRFAMATQGVPEDKIHVTRNGLRPERFKDGPWEKDPWKFVFGSSPDRGLDRAMLVLDKVREKYPQIKLHIHYGWSHLDKYGLGDLRVKLEAMAEERKDWVIYHGATQQDELMKSYKSAAYVVQPSDWIETSCLTAMEFVSCGVYPIFRAVGGVVDTLSVAAANGMATLVDADCITPEDFDVYVKATLEAIEEERYKRVQFDPETISWEKVARSWLYDLPEIAYGGSQDEKKQLA